MSTIKFKGKTVKFKYEVALKQHVKGNVDDDYESVDFITASSYKQAVKTAKDWSKQLGSDCNSFKETETLDAGLAQVVIVCHYKDNTSDYNEVWQEEYINGKKTERFSL